MNEGYEVNVYQSTKRSIDRKEKFHQYERIDSVGIYVQILRKRHCVAN